MKRFALLLFSSCAVLFATAQEEIFLDSISKHPQLQERQPFSGQNLDFDERAFPGPFNLSENALFDQPLLPLYNKNLDFLNNLNPPQGISHSFSFTGPLFNPVFPNGYVFNQSAYRLNDRFLLGGNTFGAQSVFDQPKLNSAIQDMSIRGAGMFMQYKVNDHFKVETRISISNRRSAPWKP